MRAPFTLLACAALAVSLAAQSRSKTDLEADFIEIDASVVDGRGRPVRGLKRTDFTVRDNGKPVDIETFVEVSGPQPGDPDSARTVVLLLDDTGVLALGTQTIQTIARAFVSSAAGIDDVPVVRLHERNDEPFGDRIVADARIREYRGGASPFIYWSTTKDVLDRVAEMSKLVAANTSRRRVIVCVGSPFICNLREPQSTAPRSFEQSWQTALREAALANVVVHALIPGRAPLRGGGLPDLTGGQVFATTYDIGAPIDRILESASNYYVLGYWPVRQSKGLQRVDVKVAGKGLRVKARKLR